jgi:hypothetical protein
LKLFVCHVCPNILYFENRYCGRCGLGFQPEPLSLAAMESEGRTWRLFDGTGRRYLCRNAELDSCNWLTDPDEGEGFCRACLHNGVLPDLSDPLHLSAWREIEIAKHRLFYSLLRWRLP